MGLQDYQASSGLSVDVVVNRPPSSRVDHYGILFQGPGVARFPRGQTRQRIYDTPRYPVIATTYQSTLPHRLSLPLRPQTVSTPDIWRTYRGGYY